MKKDISLLLKPADELPPILGSKRAIEEVISNLLTNAIKYTSEGGNVALVRSAGRALRAHQREGQWHRDR